MISFLLCLALLIIGYFVYGKIVDNTFGPERAVVGVDQHVPHDLTLGGAFFEHQMELVQRPLGHGGGPHIS